MEKLRTLAIIFGHNLRELAIAFDQMINVCIGILTMRQAWSDETMSAHCWRSYRDGRIWGKWFMPPIDWAFSWQKQTEEFKDEKGALITGHCRRAYCKEKARDYLPPEYREAPKPTQ